MFTVSRGIRVNDGSDPEQPVLTRNDVWRGLVLKADNALPFVPKMTKCEVNFRAPTWLERDVVFRDEPASERVTFFPRQEVRFERLSGATLGTIQNLIEESESGELILRFTFSLEREGIEPGSAEEEAYAKEMEGAYLGAVDATLKAIRQFTTAATADSPVEVAVSPEAVGYVDSVIGTLDRRELDKFQTLLAAGATARIGNADPVTGGERIGELVAGFLTSANGPKHSIVDVWHSENLIGAEVGMTAEVDARKITAAAVYLLRMDGDLIEDLRLVGDFGPLTG